MELIKTVEKTEEPWVVIALTIIGWVAIIAGFILGCTTASSSGLGIIVLVMYWGIGGVSGIVMIGMAKIIELLSDIANKDYVVVKDLKPEEKKTDKQE